VSIISEAAPLDMVAGILPQSREESVKHLQFEEGPSSILDDGDLTAFSEERQICSYLRRTTTRSSSKKRLLYYNQNDK
jgi:hypothetical protein